ncbi:ankyrin repeat domain-containing protein [Rhizobium leguminosarum]|uniref:ankyrin repeat domain-containing protein n=1 Tax=Rhizobium leguminosarum TaxID=384 RepID=UPI0028AE8857|nr:ankyrin repeat domain-containing protein [Rhizobium leguminosarum]
MDAQGPYNGLTALHDAAWHGHLDAVRSLIKAGARLDLLGHAGLTPRALALQYGYNEIASLLVERNEST